MTTAATRFLLAALLGGSLSFSAANADLPPTLGEGPPNPTGAWVEIARADNAEPAPPTRERVEQAAKVIADPVPPTLPPPPPEEVGLSILERLETSSLATWVAESLYGYPAVLGLHAIGLAILVGLLIFVNLNLLSVIGDIRLSALLGPMKLAWFGFVMNALSGFALFSSQATFIIYSKPFLTKIGLVFLGALIAFHIQRQVTKNVDNWEAGSLPASIRAAAGVSLLCWMGAIIAGRLIAYL